MDPSAMTSVAVRDELESRLERDLLGPWDGPEEELPPKVQPAERYLVGRLVPAVPPPREADDDDDDDGDAVLALSPETVEAEGGSLDERVTPAPARGHGPLGEPGGVVDRAVLPGAGRRRDPACLRLVGPL